jgi:transposase
MAIVQLGNPTEGRLYFDRKVASGKGNMEAMRWLKRRLSDIVYRRMLDDAIRKSVTGPGGHQGTSTDSSVDRLTSPCRLSGEVTSRTRRNTA